MEIPSPLSSVSTPAQKLKWTNITVDDPMIPMYNEWLKEAIPILREWSKVAFSSVL
jgi:hypothetical protein